MYKFVLVLCIIILFIKFVIINYKILFYNFCYINLQIKNFVYILFSLGLHVLRWGGAVGGLRVRSTETSKTKRWESHEGHWGLLLVWNRSDRRLGTVARELAYPTWTPREIQQHYCLTLYLTGGSADASILSTVLSPDPSFLHVGAKTSHPVVYVLDG